MAAARGRAVDLCSFSMHPLRWSQMGARKENNNRKVVKKNGYEVLKHKVLYSCGVFGV